MMDFNDPAPEQIVQRLREKVPFLPRAYFEFFLSANGCEGDLGIDPGWIRLWRAEDIIDSNSRYKVEQFLPGYLAFGSNCGGEMFVFRVNGTDNTESPVYMVPFIPMEESEVVKVADSFTHLAAEFGKEMDEA